MKNQVAYSQSKKSPARIRKLHNPLPDRIGVRLSHGIECIRLEEIVCCEAWGNYTRIHLADRKDPILVSKTLKHVSSVLPDSMFFRTHQSFVIRIETITTVSNDIVLSNGMVVPLSRSQKPAFMSWIKRNITLI
jgi:DNA-binding LytR/AlgR family response regulator